MLEHDILSDIKASRRAASFIPMERLAQIIKEALEEDWIVLKNHL